LNVVCPPFCPLLPFVSADVTAAPPAPPAPMTTSALLGKFAAGTNAQVCPPPPPPPPPYLLVPAAPTRPLPPPPPPPINTIYAYFKPAGFVHVPFASNTRMI
jgi:hypothetical protein